MKGFRFVFGNDKPDNAMVGFTIRAEAEEKAVETVQKVVEALNCLGIDLGELEVHGDSGEVINLEDVVLYLPENKDSYRVTSGLIEDEWEEETTNDVTHCAVCSAVVD